MYAGIIWIICLTYLCRQIQLTIMVAFICELCYIQLKGIYLADCSPLVPQASPGGHGLIYEIVYALSIYFWNKFFFIKWLSQIASPARLGSSYLLILICSHKPLSIGAGHFVIKHTTYEIEYK